MLHNSNSLVKIEAAATLALLGNTSGRERLENPTIMTSSQIETFFGKAAIEMNLKISQFNPIVRGD